MSLESQTPKITSDKGRKKTFVNRLIFLGGTISLVLGIIGIVLPILPTTPFLLLSSACYAKSSKKFYNWLNNNRILGLYIRNYKEGKGMPLKVKIFTITLLWVTILITILFVGVVWIQIMLLIISIAVSIHIILIRPKKRSS